MKRQALPGSFCDGSTVIDTILATSGSRELAWHLASRKGYLGMIASYRHLHKSTCNLVSRYINVALARVVSSHGLEDAPQCRPMASRQSVTISGREKKQKE